MALLAVLASMHYYADDACMCVFIDQMVLRKRFVFCYEQVLHVCVYIINGLDDGLHPSQQTNTKCCCIGRGEDTCRRYM